LYSEDGKAGRMGKELTGIRSLHRKQVPDTQDRRTHANLTAGNNGKGKTI
jgi:hypothetical protein